MQNILLYTVGLITLCSSPNFGLNVEVTKVVMCPNKKYMARLIGDGIVQFRGNQVFLSGEIESTETVQSNYEVIDSK